MFIPITGNRVKNERRVCMSRKPHIWYPGATYHIMSRGNRKATIFHDDEDYRRFLDILREAKEKYPFKLHSYCLMSNHVHLELGTIDDDSSQIMSYILKTYSTYYNRKYEYVGHLYQGRYKGILIEDEAYFMQTSRYIHLNPVKAGIVSSPEKYEFSSYRLYAENKESDLVSKETTLSLCRNDVSEFRAFVENYAPRDEEKAIQKKLRENDLWLP